MVISPASSSPTVPVTKCVDDLAIFFFQCSGVCPERGSVRAIISYSYVKHFVQSFTSTFLAFFFFARRVESFEVTSRGSDLLK
jgi:hypothetical protein